MLHYVHQLAANFVCLFGTGKVMYSGIFKSFLNENNCLLLLEIRLMRTELVRLRAKTMSQNNELKDTKMLRIVEGKCGIG